MPIDDSTSCRGSGSVNWHPVAPRYREVVDVLCQAACRGYQLIVRWLDDGRREDPDAALSIADPLAIAAVLRACGHLSVDALRATGWQWVLSARYCRSTWAAPAIARAHQYAAPWRRKSGRYHATICRCTARQSLPTQRRQGAAGSDALYFEVGGVSWYRAGGQARGAPSAASALRALAR